MVAGIAFAILMPVGTIVQFSGLPDYDGGKDSDAVIAQRVHDALASSGHRAQVIVGAYLMIVASLCLIWFALGLRARLAEAAPERTVAGSLVSSFGLLGAAALAVGGALNATIPGAISFGNDRAPAASASESVRFLTQLGTPLVLLVFALALAALIATMTVCALARVGLPRWLGFAGWVGVLGAIFGVEFLPLVLPLLWALVVGALGLRTGPVASSVATRSGAAVA
jgi:hypothetical protein